MAAIPSRTGIPSLQKVAKASCDLIARYGTVIRLVGNQDPALIAALEAAQAACAVLDSELEKIRDYGD